MDTNTSNPKREQRELRSIELQQIATRTAEPTPEEEQTNFELFFSCREEPAVNRGISLRANQTCRMQPK
jgi:hypothetical protein